MMAPDIYHISPAIIQGYNDRRKTMQVHAPNENDIGEDSPHMFIFTRFNRVWIEKVVKAIETFEGEGADGMSVKESMESLALNWSDASDALIRMTRFGAEFTDYLSAGPGVPHTPVCAMCQVRQPHDKGADLCGHCLISVLAPLWG